jgi:hypothetical protein
MAFDLADGIDYDCVPFTCRPSGDPVFADAEIIVGPACSIPGCPTIRCCAACSTTTLTMAAGKSAAVTCNDDPNPGCSST